MRGGWENCMHEISDCCCCSTWNELMHGNLPLRQWTAHQARAERIFKSRNSSLDLNSKKCNCTHHSAVFAVMLHEPAARAIHVVAQFTTYFVILEKKIVRLFTANTNLLQTKNCGWINVHIPYSREIRPLSSLRRFRPVIISWEYGIWLHRPGNYTMQVWCSTIHATCMLLICMARY